MTAKQVLSLILLIAACTLFIMDSFGIVHARYPELVALGLAIWVLALIIDRV